MYLGYMLLTIGLLLTITGIGMSFSKKERQRMQKRVMTELPERSSTLGSPDALKVAQRRGYITLLVGAALLILWFFLFGFKSLAIG